MKNVLIPAIALLIAGSSPVWAWSHVTGSITKIDPSEHQLALDNGDTYTLRANVNMAKLAVGDKVRLNAETLHGKHIANKVTKTG